MAKRWVPLESNPEVLNNFAANLGLEAGKIAFCDVYGFDEELQALVPRPVYAVIFLFPVSDALDAQEAKADEERRKQGAREDPGVFYMKQTIGNACGTIALLHAIGNNQAAAKIREGSFLQQFFGATASMSAAERGHYLENPPPGAPDLEAAHAAAAEEGSSAPELDESLTPHFVALIHHDGRLLELDGRKALPVDHGPTSQDDLLKDASKVGQKFVDRIQGIHFNMIALTAADS